MATVTRLSASSTYGRCDHCPGVQIRWADRAAHTAAGVVHLVTDPPLADPALLAGWGLPVWRDEFDGDLSKWNVRNNDTANGMLERRMAANVTVAGGQLGITAKRDATGAITSGYVDTIGKDDKIGPGTYIEIAAKFPTDPDVGRGMWSALWLRGDTGSGEIDLVEAYSNKPDLQNAWECIVITLHADTMVAGGNSKNFVYRFPPGQFPYQVAHRYAVELAADRLRFFIDGVKVWEPTVTQLPWLAGMLTQTYNLRVNQQISAASTWFYAPDAGTVFPRQMLVDFVRVYGGP